MIDLRKKGLPDTVMVGGSPFKIKTDFRVWIDFWKKIQSPQCTLADITFVFDGTVPRMNFYNEVCAFFQNPNLTPKPSDDSGEILIDYVEDGEYIYASFLAEYNIDLVDVKNLHWHKFKALLSSLSDNSKIKQIIRMRGYTKSNEKVEHQYERLKQTWRLPQPEDVEHQAMLDEFNSL